MPFLYTKNTRLTKIVKKTKANDGNFDAGCQSLFSKWSLDQYSGYQTSSGFYEF